VALVSLALVTLIRQDIRLGISVFGDLTAFKAAGDIIRMGIEYQKGLGILVAILLSVFIGQEYQWKTWQHKWITNKSRPHIYHSKAVFSAIGSAAIFLIYEIVALLTSGQIQNMLTNGYAAMILCGAFIYAALGTVICLLSMLIKNSTASTIVCICYVMFSETLASVLQNIAGFSAIVGRVIEAGISHSVYGMSMLVSSTTFSADYAVGVVINALIIMILSTAFGVFVFRKYEL
jgi:hypothetical protein